MPSTSEKQHNLMEMVAHGGKPRKGKGPPVSVAKEFVAADKAGGKYDGACGYDAHRVGTHNPFTGRRK